MKSLLRIAGLALTVAILPSCRRDHDEKWVWVTVTNEGAVSADLKAEAASSWGIDDEVRLSIGPGAWVQFRFRYEGLIELEIHLYRSTDHFLIFSETYDREELDDLDQRVDITVSP